MSQYLGSLPYLCTKNETMAPLHVVTLTVQRELHKYEFSIQGLYPTSVSMQLAPITVVMWLHSSGNSDHFNFIKIDDCIIIIIIFVQKKSGNSLAASYMSKGKTIVITELIKLVNNNAQSRAMHSCMYIRSQLWHSHCDLTPNYPITATYRGWSNDNFMFTAWKRGSNEWTRTCQE